MHKIKQKVEDELIGLIFLILLALFTIGGYNYGNSRARIVTITETITITSNDNLESCLAQGGEYSLSAGEDDYMNYEWCYLNKRIHY